MTQDEEAYLVGKTTAETIVDDSSPAFKWISPDYREELIQEYFAFYYTQMSHMDDDPIYLRTVEAIIGYPEAKESWLKLVNNGIRDFIYPEEMKIVVDTPSGRLPLYYSIINLPINKRFLIVEYTTKNQSGKYIDMGIKHGTNT